MADSIIVNVSELRSRLQDIRRDGMSYVEISIFDAEENEDDISPASLSLSGCRIHDTHTWVDYEDVEAVPDNEKLQSDSFLGIHMSSDLC